MEGGWGHGNVPRKPDKLSATKMQHAPVRCSMEGRADKICGYHCLQFFGSLSECVSWFKVPAC